MFATIPDAPVQLDDIETQIRDELSGRPLQFRLSPNERGLMIEAVVPTSWASGRTGFTTNHMYDGLPVRRIESSTDWKSVVRVRVNLPLALFEATAAACPAECLAAADPRPYFGAVSANKK